MFITEQDDTGTFYGRFDDDTLELCEFVKDIMTLHQPRAAEFIKALRGESMVSFLRDLARADNYLNEKVEFIHNEKLFEAEYWVRVDYNGQVPLGFYGNITFVKEPVALPHPQTV